MFDASDREHEVLSSLLPSGTWHCEVMDNPAGWYHYTLKQAWRPDHTDRIQILPML